MLSLKTLQAIEYDKKIVVEKAVDNLAGLSEEKLNEILDAKGIGKDDPEREEIEGLVNHAAAMSFINNRRGARPFDVQTAVDCVIRTRKSGNAAVARYVHDSGEMSMESLQGIAAANSISFDREAYNERRASEPEHSGESRADSVRRSMTAIREASRGAYSLDELNKHYENVVSAQSSSDSELHNIIEEESEKMNYTLDDFKLNLAVQTINNSGRAYGDEEAQARIDDAIRVVKHAPQNSRTQEILNGMNADVDKLDEVEGIGEVRARTIKQSLRRMQEQFMFDNLMI